MNLIDYKYRLELLIELEHRLHVDFILLRELIFVGRLCLPVRVVYLYYFATPFWV